MYCREKALREQLCEELGRRHPFLRPTDSHGPSRSWKIEYFNQRRLIAEAQKDRLAQAKTQSAVSKKS